MYPILSTIRRPADVQALSDPVAAQLAGEGPGRKVGRLRLQVLQGEPLAGVVAADKRHQFSMPHH